MITPLVARVADRYLTAKADKKTIVMQMKDGYRWQVELIDQTGHGGFAPHPQVQMSTDGAMTLLKELKKDKIVGPVLNPLLEDCDYLIPSIEGNKANGFTVQLFRMAVDGDLSLPFTQKAWRRKPTDVFIHAGTPWKVKFTYTSVLFYK